MTGDENLDPNMDQGADQGVPGFDVEYEGIPPIMHFELMNISLMRIYDVQSAILSHLDPDLWAMIDAKHSKGQFYQGPPFMDGENPWGGEDE